MKLSPIFFSCLLSLSCIFFDISFCTPNTTAIREDLAGIVVTDGVFTIGYHIRNMAMIRRALYRIMDHVTDHHSLEAEPKQQALEALWKKVLEIGFHHDYLSWQCTTNLYDVMYLGITLPAYLQTYHNEIKPALRELVQELENTQNPYENIQQPNIENILAALEDPIL